MAEVIDTGKTRTPAESDVKKVYSALVQERLDEAYGRDCEGQGENILIIDDMEDALIGTTERDGIVVAVYESNLCIRSLAKKFLANGSISESVPEGERVDEAMEKATEWFEYNTLRAIPYEHERAPMVIDGFMCDEDKWGAFLDD